MAFDESKVINRFTMTNTMNIAVHTRLVLKCIIYIILIINETLFSVSKNKQTNIKTTVLTNPRVCEIWESDHLHLDH